MPANPVNTIVEITQQQYDHAAALFAQINELHDKITFGNLSERRLLISRRKKLIEERLALLGANGDQFVALKRFAARHGRQWKSVLRCAWATGRYAQASTAIDDAALLQQLRNVRGLQWLDSFRLPPEGQ